MEPNPNWNHWINTLSSTTVFCSKETCVFLHKKENLLYRSNQINPIKIYDDKKDINNNEDWWIMVNYTSNITFVFIKLFHYN